MIDCLSAPAALRNRGVILDVLDELLPADSEVLEIGSGTGEHAVHFAGAMPEVTWHTSDLADSHTAINAWIARSGLGNVRPPVLLDVRNASAWHSPVDVIYSANTMHIMSADTVDMMLKLAGRIIRPGGWLMVYGPFRLDGAFTSDSNRLFDTSLRARDPDMGIRDLEWVDRRAAAAGLSRSEWFAMPANNYLLAWRKAEL